MWGGGKKDNTFKITKSSRFYDKNKKKIEKTASLYNVPLAISLLLL